MKQELTLCANHQQYQVGNLVLMTAVSFTKSLALGSLQMEF